MSSKVLIIYEYQILFELLNEIKENFSFKLIKSDNEHFKSLHFDPSTNYLILSSKKYEKIGRLVTIDNKPLKLEKLIDFISIPSLYMSHKGDKFLSLSTDFLSKSTA